jgi:hypothetical protein
MQEEYRVVHISGLNETAMTTQLNAAAVGGWTVVAASPTSDPSRSMWVVLRRAAQ